MTTRMNLLACALVLGVAAAPAAAATVDFDTLPGGATVADETPISTQYASLGVTFSAVYGQDVSVLPVATSYSAGQPGPNYSGNYLGNAPSGSPYIFNPSFQLTPRYDLIRISFAGTADDVSLSLNNFSLIGTTTFNAYGAGGELLQTFTTNAGTGWSVRSLSVDGVSRLDLVTNSYNDLPQFFGIDQLNFTLNTAAAVPEPASWAMMILGMGLIGGVLRRRQSVTAKVRFA